MSPTNTTTHLDRESKTKKERKEKSGSLKKGYKTVERRRKTRLQRGWRMKWWKTEWWVRVDGMREREKHYEKKENGREMYRSDSDEMFSSTPCLSVIPFNNLSFFHVSYFHSLLSLFSVITPYIMCADNYSNYLTLSTSFFHWWNLASSSKPAGRLP